MDEEEKKAIYYFKNLDISFNTLLRIDLNGFKYALDTILNLIKKQHKEIEKRLKEIDSLYKMMSAKDERIENLMEMINSYNDMAYIRKIEELYISKDKIRHIRDKAECMDYYSLNDVIDDLTKLIGE